MSYKIYEKLRDKKKETDYTVAQKTGIGRSTLSEWKTGKHTLNLANTYKLSKYFDVPMETFIDKHE